MKVSPHVVRFKARAKAQKETPSPIGMDCVDCGEPATCRDHRDYTKPLDVVPVCSKCNKARGEGYPPINGPDVEVPWITHVKEDMSVRRFELRLSEKELIALNRLAHKQGRDRSKLVAGMIRQQARRHGIWNELSEV